jgi:hypothetical protein
MWQNTEKKFIYFQNKCWQTFSNRVILTL